MNHSSRKQKRSGERAQAIVEFAIVLPILLVLLIGILEVGRMVFIYSAVSNASREAVHYATAFGLDDDGLTHYNNCAGIREMARKSAYFMNLQPGDVTISYDQGPGTTPTNALCDGTDTVSSGDRVLVSVTTQYHPLINLVPIRSRTFSSSSARTVLGIFELTP